MQDQETPIMPLITRIDERDYCISLLILLIGFFFFLRQYLLIGYLDVNWDSSIIFDLLKEGFYNEMFCIFITAPN